MLSRYLQFIFTNNRRVVTKAVYTMSEAVMKRASEDAQCDTEAKKCKLDDSLGAKNGADSNVDALIKAKAKKFAMCLSYSGKDYYGMQRNPGVKTIEEDLFKAMLDANIISEAQFADAHTFQFQRAARTDKGVSAVRQVVSLKLPTTMGSPEELVERINKNLVEQIRVIGIKRVTRGFNSKNSCDARTYAYVAPTFAFAPGGTVADESYRMPPERVKELNEILAKYKGSHNFHNFTSGRKAEDPSAMRYIISCEAGSPFIVDGIEYIQITLKGQSFVLHQIRKMVGLVIAIMREHTKVDTMIRAWGPEKLDLPVAPALGLMLEQVHYERYDKRYGGDGDHEQIRWDEKQDIIQAFKEKYILQNIVETERQEESMISWMTTLDLHTYDVRNEEPALSNAQLEQHVCEDGDDDDAEETCEERGKKSELSDVLGLEDRATVS